MTVPMMVHAGKVETIEDMSIMVLLWMLVTLANFIFYSSHFLSSYLTSALSLVVLVYTSQQVQGV